MKSGDLCCHVFQCVTADDFGCRENAVLVDGLVDVLEKLIVLDDALDAVDLDLRPANPGTLGYQHEAFQVRLDGEAQTLWKVHHSGIKDAFQNQDVPFVLLDWGRNAIGFVVEKGSEFAMVIDRDPFGKMLALAHPYVQPTIDDKVINLSNQITELDA